MAGVYMEKVLESVENLAANWIRRRTRRRRRRRRRRTSSSTTTTTTYWNLEPTL